MSKVRGRPCKVMPIHPNLVLTRSLKTALSTAVYLQRSINNKHTTHLYESSRKILAQAKQDYQTTVQQGFPDLEPITEAENNIRKNSLQMLFEMTAPYGNTEVRRVKSSDKSVGPLNQRFNAGGAVLRNFGMTNFPFPDRELLAGFTQDTFGYPGNSLCHKVVPIHTLSELDFVDVCRKHIQILNAWCYIYDVSVTDTAKYSNLFLLKARPYLERIYSENKYGKAGFRKGTVKILRNLKNDIATHYRVRTGDGPTVTSSIERRQPDYDVTFFKDQIEEARKRGILSPTMDEIDRILKGGSIVKTVWNKANQQAEAAPCLTKEDVKYIWQKIFELSGQKGTQVHRQITGLYPSHWNIGRVIRFGDELGGDDGYLLCSEIPIDTALGKGRIDLILFRRVISSDGLNAYWKPVFVLDIKTRQGYSWEMGVEIVDSDSRRRHGLSLRRVPEFIISERSLTNEEWNDILASNPDGSIVAQVNAYADAVEQEFLEKTQTKDSLQVLKGSMFIDGSEDIRTIRSAIRSFVIEVFEKINELDTKIPRTAFNIKVNQKSPKIAILLHQQENPYSSEEVSVPAPLVQVQDPFQALVDQKREFILYLSGGTKTSGGNSAAWIAKYYHGLQLINEWRGKNSSSKILWIDLVDEFIHSDLREARLYLRSRSGSFRDRTRSHSDTIRSIFDSIEIVGLYDRISEYLFRDGDIPILQSNKDTGLIVVSGWGRLQDSTPSSYQDRLGELKNTLVSQLTRTDNSTILWFDDPLPGEQNSSVYSTRTLIPYYQDSPFFSNVTQIIWNLPVAPESEVLDEDWTLPYTASVPLYDDIRVITRQKQDGFSTELVNIPPLVGWSRKFRSDFVESELDELLQEKIPPLELREKMRVLSFDLIPWLLELWPKSDCGRITRQTLTGVKSRYDVPRTAIEVGWKELGSFLQCDSLLERIKYRPVTVRGGKSYVSIALGSINSHRFYREQYQIRSKKRGSYEGPLKDSLKPLERLLLGRIYSRITPEMQDELLILENPLDSTRLLIGHFSDSSRKDQSGFLWSVSNPERLQAMISDFDSLDFDDLLLRIKTDEQELWQWDTDSSEWLPRSIVEILGNRLGLVGSISGFNEKQLETSEKIDSNIRIPTSFNQRVKHSLQSIVKQKNQSVEVNVLLRVEDGSCVIGFLTPEQEEIHQIEVQSVPDLIKVLRLSLSDRGAVRSSNGEMLVWNPFTDIEYGELELIRNYIETNAPRDVGRKLPRTIQSLMKDKEVVPLELILSHKREACPIVNGTGGNHNACWIMKSEENGQISDLFKMPMTGREIFGLLSKGILDTEQATYKIEILLDYEEGSREFYVYHENNWIRRLLRESNVNLKRLSPGTFLRDDEQWIINYIIRGNNVEWSGVSNLTGLYWMDQSFQFSLNPSLNLQDAKQEFLKNITDVISQEIIHDYSKLDSEIEILLSNRGYGEQGPRCFLSISRRGNEFTVTLAEDNGLTIQEIKTNSFIIEKTTNREDVLEGFYSQFDSGEFSVYNIINVEEFMKNLEKLLDEIGIEV